VKRIFAAVSVDKYQHTHTPPHESLLAGVKVHTSINVLVLAMFANLCFAPRMGSRGKAYMKSTNVNIWMVSHGFHRLPVHFFFSQRHFLGLEADLTSSNAAMSACENGSQWKQASCQRCLFSFHSRDGISHLPAFKHTYSKKGL
jgi:hypothetical protein